MFVEKLTKEQVDQFIQKHLKETDFHTEFSNKRKIELFSSCRGEDAIGIHYCSKLYNGWRTLYLMDNRIEPFISRELEENWIKHLYSILDKEHKIGEVYKNWFLSEKEKLFE